MRPAPAVAALTLVLADAAQAQPAGLPADAKAAVYVTSHVDVTPDYVEQAKAALRAYVAAARSEPGAMRVEAVQEPRPNHFDLVEVWRDRAAYEAHLKTPATIAFHDAIHPWRGSPFEERLGTLIAP
jgi:quinol monooxygenase YgiN